MNSKEKEIKGGISLLPKGEKAVTVPPISQPTAVASAMALRGHVTLLYPDTCVHVCVGTNTYTHICMCICLLSPCDSKAARHARFALVHGQVSSSQDSESLDTHLPQPQFPDLISTDSFLPKL